MFRGQIIKRKVQINILMLLSFICYWPHHILAYDQIVQDIVNSVSIDSLIKHVRVLSGEDPYVVGDSIYYITDRQSSDDLPETKGHQLSRQYLRAELEKYCSYVIEQKFPFRNVDTIRNIIGFKTGTVNADRLFITSGHYDSINMRTTDLVAPGADDNASGVATVLEAARLLSQYDIDNSIAFILWDWEEQGAVGAEIFCTSYTDIDKIDGMITVDMIAYDPLDSNIVHIYNGMDSIATIWSNHTANLIGEYSIDLLPRVINDAVPTDAMPFWGLRVCPTIAMTEKYIPGAETNNPFYHSTDDRIKHFNLKTYENLAKLAIATSAEMGFNGVLTDIQDEIWNNPQSYSLVQNYPNPFNPSTTIHYELPKASDVSLIVYDMIGREVTQLVDEFNAAGVYSITWDGINSGGTLVPTGVYFARLQAEDYSETIKMVYLK